MPTRSLSRFLRLETLEAREVPATLFALTNANSIARFDSTTPGAVDGLVSISGLNAGESVVGIDFRPRTGQLFGLAVGTNGTGTAARLLTVNPLTGVSGAVGSGFTLSAGDPSAGFGFDFNPTVDRIRVINELGLNLRLNPNDGTIAGTDANINVGTPEIDAAAYDRNYDGKLGGAGTTLYTLRAASGTLQTQGTVNQVVSPNSGTQVVVGSLGVNIDSNSPVGFDIAANGTAAGGPAYAIFDGDTTSVVNTGLYTINLTTGAGTRVSAVGNGSTNFIGLAVAPESRYAVGSGAGTAARVELYDTFTNTRLRTFDPFPGFTGGVTVATGDVNRDSVPDVIVGAGAGADAHVKVFDGSTGAELSSFYAYDRGFRGGVSVAAGDVNGDGFADLVIAAGSGGGPHVQVFGRSSTGTVAPFTGVAGLSNSFFAYDTGFTGGVNVAVGDVNGDGFADIITGADTGAGPHVKAFNGRTTTEVASFFAYPQAFNGGVRVGVGDVDRDGRVEILAASGAGRTAGVRAFDANTGTQLGTQKDVLSGDFGVFIGGGLV